MHLRGVRGVSCLRARHEHFLDFHDLIVPHAAEELLLLLQPPLLGLNLLLVLLVASSELNLYHSASKR